MGEEGQERKRKRMRQEMISHNEIPFNEPAQGQLETLSTSTL